MTSPRDPLHADDSVRIFGLVESIDFNGVEATLVQFVDPDSWLIKLEDGTEFQVGEGNLIASCDYDSDEDYCSRRVAKRQRVAIEPSPQTSLQTAEEHRPGGVIWQVLSTYCFPAGCTCSENAPVYRAFKQLEKFELAVQCDDFADSELRAFNSEALLYGRSAAVVAGLPEPLSQGRQLCHATKAAFVQRLVALPFFGPFRAAQAYEILTTGTCEALQKFELGLPPTSSDGSLRLSNEASRSMRHAPAKRALGKVFGMGVKTAIDLVEATGKFQGLPPITSLGDLLRSPAHLTKLRADTVGRDGPLMASLVHYDELQEAVPEAEAEAMRAAVLSVVRRQHSLRVGATRDCPAPASPADRCTCCWHAEFVGGARTCGRAGHDVDLLLWHHTEPNSWGEGADQCVLLPLMSELWLDEEDEASQGAREPAGAATAHHRAGVLPKRHGRCQVVRRSHSEKQRLHKDGAPCYLPAPPAQQGGAKGYENLNGDWHDKCMGIWRSAAGRHHRIDIVIVAKPEELPFARLTWTGSRTFNRMLRQRAIQLGLHLTANGLVAKPPIGVHETRVVLEARPGRERAEAVVRGCGQVPVGWTQSEEDIIRILACGTDAFAGVYDPLMRNA